MELQELHLRILRQKPLMLHEELLSAVNRAAADLLTLNLRLYLEHFSPEEVNDLNAFYVTPSGKKMLQYIPMLLQPRLYLWQEWT